MPGPGVVEEILLRVAAKFTKIFPAEVAQPASGDLPLSPEVVLAQHALDPDIDGKGADPLVGEEQDAIGNLLPDPGQPA